MYLNSLNTIVSNNHTYRGTPIVLARNLGINPECLKKLFSIYCLAKDVVNSVYSVENCIIPVCSH